MKLVACLLLLFAYTNIVESRTTECHWRAVNKCIYDSFYFSHRPNMTGLALNSTDFELLCKLVRYSHRCIGKFVEKCGTETHTALYSLFKDYMVNKVKEFCKDGPLKSNYLKYAPCIHSLRRDPIYKKTCVNDMQAGLEFAGGKYSLDDRLNTSCCVYHSWHDCVGNMAFERCGGGDTVMDDYFGYGSGGLVQMICKREHFDPNSEFCKSKKPPPGTQALGRKSKSVFSKMFTLSCPYTGW